MPFIKNIQRLAIEHNGPLACKEVGDITYVFYRHFVKAWNYEPRWRTAHRLYRDSFDDEFFQYVCDQLYGKYSRVDICNAADLAWQVFFLKYVLPYENLQEEKNGTI